MEDKKTLYEGVQTGRGAPIGGRIGSRLWLAALGAGTDSTGLSGRPLSGTRIDARGGGAIAAGIG